MISRRTALVLAETYADMFSVPHYAQATYSSSYKTHFSVKTDALYDFLYTCNYASWFCNESKSTHQYAEGYSRATRKLKEFVMKLHTGETQYDVTPDWDWKQREQLGQEYLINLATDILNRLCHDLENATGDDIVEIEKTRAQLERNLELDGYAYRDSRLVASEVDVLDVAEETGALQSLFMNLGLQSRETVFHHLSLSEDHYINEKWDDSVANSRKFLEGVLQETAALYSQRVKGIPLPDSIHTRPVRVRDYLENEGLLEPKEKEAVGSVYGLLSETGGHPYMARSDQARLLRHLSLTFSQFVMLRLRGRLAEPSQTT